MAQSVYPCIIMTPLYVDLKKTNVYTSISCSSTAVLFPRERHRTPKHHLTKCDQTKWGLYSQKSFPESTALESQCIRSLKCMSGSIFICSHFGMSASNLNKSDTTGKKKWTGVLIFPYRVTNANKINFGLSRVARLLENCQHIAFSYQTYLTCNLPKIRVVDFI
jgi:hypothetical protein